MKQPFVIYDEVTPQARLRVDFLHTHNGAQQCQWCLWLHRQRYVDKRARCAAWWRGILEPEVRAHADRRALLAR